MPIAQVDPFTRSEEKKVYESELMITIAAILLVLHGTLAVGMLVLWIIRRISGTWTTLDVYNSDWDLCQRGMVIHSVGTIVCWVVTAMNLNGWYVWHRYDASMFTGWALGALSCVLGISVVALAFLDGSKTPSPAPRTLRVCGIAVAFTLGLTMIIGFLALLYMQMPLYIVYSLVCGACSTILSCIATLVTVLWYSLRDHQALRRGKKLVY